VFPHVADDGGSGVGTGVGDGVGVGTGVGIGTGVGVGTGVGGGVVLGAGVITILSGKTPTGMGLPGVLVATSIGVTVPLKLLLTT
jgi:hypothetical protein